VRNDKGQPVAATITARGKGTVTAKSDPLTGRYDLELEEGSWNVSAAGSGYVSQVEPVALNPREAGVRDFTLAELPKKMALQGVFFDSGAATIKRESFSALEQAAKFLLANEHVQVVIEGHTDNSGSPDGNVALSQRRADAVMKYLVVNHGVSPGRVKAKGVGPAEPVASNDTAEGRAMNRRIEFEVLGGPAE
jgi:outer membrane protein OmpA-like peptidoglycan-associated protein